MSFSGAVQKFGLHVGNLGDAVHVAATDLLFESIVEGSPITGSPGQPYASGALHDSWTKTFPDKYTGVVATNSSYAPAVEENLKGMVFKNHGPHSLKLSVVGWLKIVEQAVRTVAK